MLGLGKAGRSVVEALLAGGATPVVHDDNPRAVADLGLAGVEQADLIEGSWDGIDLLAASPGITHLYPTPHPVIARAWGEGVPVDNEIGLFFRAIARSGAFVVAITGTNGKSTTTALIRHLVEAAGRPVQMGGNIGVPVLGLAAPAPGDVVVLELSSYQIDQARLIAPDVALFLNLTPDHYDRHGGHGGYFAAKRRLFEVGRPRVAVIGVDEAEGRFLANQRRAGRVPGEDTIAISAERPLGGRGRSFSRDGSAVVEYRDGDALARYELSGIGSLRGVHNAQNAAAAIAAVRGLGIAPPVIAAALKTFPGLAHRLEQVGRRGRVLFINDSKATNADAAARALASFGRLYWIAGGKPKEGGIESLAPFFPRIVKAYLIGEAADAFARTLEGRVPYVLSGDLATATAAAARDAAADAAEGEEPVVLLSPACASFDQFPNFEKRGDVFRALVEALPGLSNPGGS
ncbi:UDP-N-acetylmuramoyl-L-alanine--D-glutamate ligase [Segnochrobactrum spirostomi]|uniref:UDP-N-acetylmuramoyl-L-alanine--D-glutamate ligase n=1 Tax=Segnochrobactrum spirostomi TaxID=2608987 RepID=UPI0028B094EB|nr:UDP-N-acetylmuramoyl-L-alanine--D-glutamate ligase [Segnochrobactrum spirostomi]